MSDPVRELTRDEVIDCYAKWNVGALPTARFQELEPIRSPDFRIDQLSETGLFEAPIQDPVMARCALAGLKLLYGQLDPSHEISQSIAAPEGSYWHAIMHRIEGDYGNCKYWYRRVGDHPVIQQLADRTPGYPMAWVDRIAAAQDGDDLGTGALAAVVGDEWRTLFSHCRQAAISSADEPGDRA